MLNGACVPLARRTIADSPSTSMICPLNRIRSQFPTWTYLTCGRRSLRAAAAVSTARPFRRRWAAGRAAAVPSPGAAVRFERSIPRERSRRRDAQPARRPARIAAIHHRRPRARLRGSGPRCVGLCARCAPDVNRGPYPVAGLNREQVIEATAQANTMNWKSTGDRHRVW